MPVPPKSLIANPTTALLLVSITRPLAEPAAAPFRSMSGLPEYPGWVVPSVVTGVVIAGSGDCNDIVRGPDPGISKLIVFGPGIIFECSIAYRSVPGAGRSVPGIVESSDRVTT